MRVLIDGVVAPGHPRAVGRYVRELAANMAGLHGTHVLLAHGRWHHDFFAPAAARGVDLLEIRLPSGRRIARHAWHAVRLASLARDVGADLVHVPDRVPAGRMSGTPMVTTIHDVAEYDVPDAYGQVQLRYRRLVLGRQLMAADRIITPSRFSAERLAAIDPRAGDRTTVVNLGPGVDGTTRPVRPDVDLPERFFLCVGAIQRHKNLPRAVRAFRSLADGSAGLVLVGADHNDAGALGRAMGGDASIQRLARIDDPNLAWLYANAVSLVFPSLYEGFGLPILEAMVLGCPVIASDRAAARELAASAALYVEPLDVSTMRAAMERLLDDGTLRDGLVRAGSARAALFSWQRAAEETVGVYRATLGDGTA